uniref:Huntingtin interacting protein 1 related b n=1 Tax=Scleropages formosus TaxID=113540 RepID=A0A8C9S661_SCLFO
MNSIRHVPSRVKSRRTETTLGAEREHFDKQQSHSVEDLLDAIHLCLYWLTTCTSLTTSSGIILGTHREKGAFTFWSYALGLPLASSSILSWKFCHVLHKVLRDGHQNVSANLHDRYGQLVALYAKLLCNKMEFHMKHSEIPPNLEASDEVLERTAGSDINNINSACTILCDLPVLRQLNTSIAISTTTSGQCRLAPLIQVIQDCSHLYHFTVKLLFKLHACLPADTLQGHRDRFHDQFHSLKNFFNKARDMMYFKRLIQIPKLPDSPPNFLRASALAEHVKPVVVIPDEEPQDDDDPEPLIEVSETTQPITQSHVVESHRLGWGIGLFYRDVQIDNLKREIEMLRAELERIKAEAQRYITQLKSQINSLEAELEEQRVQKQRALVENEQLRMELEALRRQNNEHENLQATFLEAEKRAQATEMRYSKLKEKHAELVSSHAELLRKSADTVKMLSATQQTQEEVARTKQQLAFEVERIKQEADMKLEEQKFEMDKLRRELEERQTELSRFQSSLQSNAGEKMNMALQSLQAEKEALMRSVSERDAELSSLRQAAQLQQSSLQQERERSSRELGELQGKLQEKVTKEQLQKKLLEEQFSLLQGTVAEAEAIIQDAVAKLDDPLHVRCTSSPGNIPSRFSSIMMSLSEAIEERADASSLLRALTQFSHLAADTIVNGSATAHMAPTDHADRECSFIPSTLALCGYALGYTSVSRASLQKADPTAIHVVVQRILKLGQELQPKGRDIRQEELGDLVDKEMAATSAAIEEAVRRIDEMMNQARKDTSGIKLEVNERILNNCTDLMKAIHMLVIASTNLQKEIVESGRGAASVREFYARNSRWTEGLISASKAVGWGATQMVESADKVVLHTGKYEELIVCSHEIAASTAQLVAASKVKADRNSRKLTTLQQASRYVNEMAAKLVASTKTGQEQIEDKDTMDFSGMSLIKLKKEEMESQVKVLELETQLENERLRLGELRKKHYELAGVPVEPLAEGNGFTSAAPLSPKPTKPMLMKKPSVAQKPNIPPKNPVRLIPQRDCLYLMSLKLTFSFCLYSSYTYRRTKSRLSLDFCATQNMQCNL